MVGLAAACAGAGSGKGNITHVTITDLESNVARMQRNIVRNQSVFSDAVEVEAAALPWGDPNVVYEAAPAGCDLILGADLCYNHQFFDPLLRSIRTLASMRGADVFVATEQRWEHYGPLWDASLARCHMKVVDEFDLPLHPRMPRQVLCQQLAVCDDAEEE
jgi:predicted nicotinamide N-methyase